MEDHQIGRSTSLPGLRFASGSQQAAPRSVATGSTASASPLPSPLLLHSSNSPLLNLERPLKRRRRASGSIQDSGLLAESHDSPLLWNAPLQQEFGEDFCKLLIATRSPWKMANNPQVGLFFAKWVPGAIVPDRRTLSGPILDREVGKVENKLKEKLRGRKATFQTDGWRNKAKQAIVATMASVDFEVSRSLNYGSLRDANIHQ
jgi:hypothetical protein